MIKVYGSYLDALKARRSIDQLLNEGYKEKQIKIVSSYKPTADHKNLWQEIKSNYSLDQYDNDYWTKGSKVKEILKEYKENLEKDEIVILLDEDPNNFDEYFSRGAPDWDEREKEFNED